MTYRREIFGRSGRHEEQQFARRLLLAIFCIVALIFAVELWADLRIAGQIAIAQGKTPPSLAALEITPSLARAVTSPLARAYNNILALLLTFIGLAIPITANLYTPKLIEIFVRDRINLTVLSTYVILTAHSLFAATMTFESYVAKIPFWISVVGAILGWIMLLPYYIYVLSFLNPETIIDRVQGALLEELRSASSSKLPTAELQRRVNQRINNFGSVLLRAVDRADRDVAIEVTRAHIETLALYNDIKPRLGASFFSVDDTILVGMSSAACRNVVEQRLWVEQRIVTQLLLAYNAALGKMPDGVSALADAVKDLAEYEASRGDPAVVDLLIHVLNTYLREAIKKKDQFSIYNCFYNYKSLTKKIMGTPRADRIPDLARAIKYYSELSRTQGMPFIYELGSYELGELTEHAYEVKLPNGSKILDVMLSFDGLAGSLRLLKSRLILGAFFLEHGHNVELDAILRSIKDASNALLAQARLGFESPVDRFFWEVTDRGVNLDYVDEQRRSRVLQLLDRIQQTSSAGPLT